MLAGDHPAVNEDGLQALVTAVNHRVQHLTHFTDSACVYDPWVRYPLCFILELITAVWQSGIGGRTTYIIKKPMFFLNFEFTLINIGTVVNIMKLIQNKFLFFIFFTTRDGRAVGRRGEHWNM